MQGVSGMSPLSRLTLLVLIVVAADSPYKKSTVMVVAAQDINTNDLTRGNKKMAEATNYYLVLDLSLDPPVKDKARLEAAIQKKLAEWEQGVNHPTKGLLFKSLAAKVSEIKKALLSDDATRDAIIFDALRIVKGRALALIDAITNGGSITEMQIDAICKKVPWFSEETIRRMVTPNDTVAPAFKIPLNPHHPPIEPMDDMLMDRIEKELTVIGEKDLYDFLGCKHFTEQSTMCRIAEEILSEARKSPCKTAEVMASQELAGLIITHFKKSGAKQSYDMALRTYAAKRDLVDIFSLRCLSNKVDWNSYQLSVRECREIGMTEDEAEYFVYEFYCLKRKCPPPIIVEKVVSVFKVPKKPADPPIMPTDNMQMDKFEKNLNVLGKKSIYDFLGCSRTSTPTAICGMAHAEFENALKAPNKTAEVSARQELSGLITSYFKKKDAKEAYDLALKTYIGQKKLVEIFAIRCASKSIDWKSYQDSIADCRAIGMSQEEAEYFVYDFYCLKRKCPPPIIAEAK